MSKVYARETNGGTKLMPGSRSPRYSPKTVRAFYS